MSKKKNTAAGEALSAEKKVMIRFTDVDGKQVEAPLGSTPGDLPGGDYELYERALHHYNDKLERERRGF
jgi:hypothetical protein